MLRSIAVSTLVVATALTGLAAYSHRILPADMDECQQDITHIGHIEELPPFHCIGHSEGNAVDGWDHIHPWMTREWHEERGLPLSGGYAGGED
ncbi:MAG: hypothetical protein GYB36_09430 [Alphaproteobacteria bacterium]|nr:hypothetical protein [Alphaproteobacteria bacterium]